MGVGVGMLEIEARASLARRPGFTERCSRRPKAAYAARQVPACAAFRARFAAKEAVVKALELENRWAVREVEVVAEGGPPRMRAARRAARGPPPGGAVDVLAVAERRTHAGRAGRADAVPMRALMRPRLPGSTPLPDARRDARDRAWAIEDAGWPSPS